MASARGPADGTHACSQRNAGFFQERHRCKFVSCGLLGSGGGGSKSVRSSSSKQFMFENISHYETLPLKKKKFKSLFTNVDEKPWVVNWSLSRRRTYRWNDCLPFTPRLSFRAWLYVYVHTYYAQPRSDGGQLSCPFGLLRSPIKFYLSSGYYSQFGAAMGKTWH